MLGDSFGPAAVLVQLPPPPFSLFSSFCNCLQSLIYIWQEFQIFLCQAIICLTTFSGSARLALALGQFLPFATVFDTRRLYNNFVA